MFHAHVTHLTAVHPAEHTVRLLFAEFACIICLLLPVVSTLSGKRAVCRMRSGGRARRIPVVTCQASPVFDTHEYSKVIVHQLMALRAHPHLAGGQFLHISFPVERSAGNLLQFFRGYFDPFPFLFFLCHVSDLL